MLCQSCKEKDANVHLKRMVAGDVEELNLCAECAVKLGYSGFFAGMFGVNSRSQGYASVQTAQPACEICGFTFEDIARTGHPGCPNCYRFFADRFSPMLIKLHGRAPYKGHFPVSFTKSRFSDKEGNPDGKMV